MVFGAAASQHQGVTGNFRNISTHHQDLQPLQTPHQHKREPSRLHNINFLYQESKFTDDEQGSRNVTPSGSENSSEHSRRKESSSFDSEPFAPGIGSDTFMKYQKSFSADAEPFIPSNSSARDMSRSLMRRGKSFSAEASPFIPSCKSRELRSNSPLSSDQRLSDEAEQSNFALGSPRVKPTSTLRLGKSFSSDAEPGESPIGSADLRSTLPLEHEKSFSDDTEAFMVRSNSNSLLSEVRYRKGRLSYRNPSSPLPMESLRPRVSSNSCKSQESSRYWFPNSYKRPQYRWRLPRKPLQTRSLRRFLSVPIIYHESTNRLQLSQQTEGNGNYHSHLFDPYTTTSTPLAAPAHATPQPQVNPYSQDTNALGGSSYFSNSTFTQPPQYHLYTPLGPHRDNLLPYQRQVHDFFIADAVREDLQRKSAATLQTLPSKSKGFSKALLIIDRLHIATSDRPLSLLSSVGHFKSEKCRHFWISKLDLQGSVQQGWEYLCASPFRR